MTGGRFYSFPVYWSYEPLTLLVIRELQIVPALGLLIIATLGITIDVSGSCIAGEHTRHYISNVYKFGTKGISSSHKFKS
jgi:hypothetical protein